MIDQCGQNKLKSRQLLTLVSRIEQSDELFFLNQIGDLFPLVWRWVNTLLTKKKNESVSHLGIDRVCKFKERTETHGWVVCYRVQNDDGSFWCLIQVLQHAGEIERFGCAVPVAVRVNAGVVGVLEQQLMVRPARCRDVDGGRIAAESQEIGDHSECTGTGQRLGTDHTTLLDGRRIVAEQHSGGQIREVLHAQNRQILVVQRFIVGDQFLCLSHDRQHPGFGCVFHSKE